MLASPIVKQGESESQMFRRSDADADASTAGRPGALSGIFISFESLAMLA